MTARTQTMHALIALMSLVHGVMEQREWRYLP